MPHEITQYVWLFYIFYILCVSGFFIWFLRKISVPNSSQALSSSETGGEGRFFFWVVLFVLIGHIITISPLVPWQKWRLWESPEVKEVFHISVSNYQFVLPSSPMRVPQGEFVQFILTSGDVTYGFGVFDKKGQMLFQLSVLPGYENKYVWKFDQSGSYDIRSTEYSGPKHSSMFIADALVVTNQSNKKG